MYYATLDQVKAEIKTQAASGAPATAPDDAYVLQALEHVTARIDALTGLAFAPRRETRYFDALGDHIDDFTQVLRLGFPLLAVETLTDGQGTALVEGTHFYFRPRGQAHTFALRRIDGNLWSAYSGAWQDAIALDGWWGWREEYALEGWYGSADALQAGVDEAATIFTVTDADGADSHGRTPRFSPGNLVQIGDELCDVVSVDYDAETLTAVRGARGSTAAAHDAGAPLSIWSVQPEVARAATVWAALLYKRRGVFEKAYAEGVTLSFPGDAPEEVAGALAPFANAMRMRAVRVL